MRRLIHKIRRIYESLRFCNDEEYNEELYWEDRHRRYNSDLRAVASGPEDIRIGRYPKQKKEFLEFLSRLEKAVCIEFGCGNGYWGKTLLEENALQYVGIDISETAIRNCKKGLPTSVFKCMNLGKDDYDLGVRGDLVFSIDVIQHIVDESKLKKFLENMAEAVKPNGFIALTSYAGFGDVHSDPQGEIDVMGFFKLPKFRFVHLWDIQTIQKHLQNCRLIGTGKFWDKTILAFKRA
ncbi:MAG: class I SAM-dependent methyltransferase [Candidatus Omnitrophica bacterium]|nr:class I SAM-dependent methyltransferase [Candidatus Omnitrophota bacterium]